MPAFVDTIEAKPSAKMILELHREETSRHSTRLKNRRRIRQIMKRNFAPFAKPPNPKEWKVIIPGTGKRIVDQAALHVSVDRPIVEVVPRGDSQRALKDADHKERFGQAILDAVNKHYAMPPTRMAAKKAFEGMWVLKGPLFDFKLWPDRPTRKEFSSDDDFKDAIAGFNIDQAETVPFSWDSIDPATIVWDADTPRNPRWVIESYHMRVTEAITKFPMFKNPNKRWDNAVVTVLEYWSRDWRCLLVDNMPATYVQEADGTEHIGVIPNIYHFQPYQIGYGVWGDTTTNDPADADVSVLFAAEDWIYEEARAASIKSWAIQRYGLPAIISVDPERTKQDLQEGAPAAVILDTTNGAAPPKPMELPQAATWVTDYDRDVRGKISEETFVDSIGGQRQVGTTSGVQEMGLLGQTELAFHPIRVDIATAANIFLQRCAWIHENLIGEPMSIYLDHANNGSRDLVTFNSDMWNGKYNFNVKLEPLDPTRDDRRAMLGLNIEAQGGLDPWTIIEDFYRYPDATKIMTRRLAWAAMNTPEMMAILGQIAFEEFGVQDEIDRLTASQGVNPDKAASPPAAGGDFAIQAPNLTPGQPANGAAPGSAEALAQGAPTRGQEIPSAQGRIVRGGLDAFLTSPQGPQ